MLYYLDQAQSVADGTLQGERRRGLNENYARELMELHTLGASGGYTQADVRALARVLTGVGVSQRPQGDEPPRMKPALRRHYLRDGLFEFNPQRHDWEPKTLLGQPLRAGVGAGVDVGGDVLQAWQVHLRQILRRRAPRRAAGAAGRQQRGAHHHRAGDGG